MEQVIVKNLFEMWKNYIELVIFYKIIWRWLQVYIEIKNMITNQVQIS